MDTGKSPDIAEEQLVTPFLQEDTQTLNTLPVGPGRFMYNLETLIKKGRDEGLSVNSLRRVVRHHYTKYRLISGKVDLPEGAYIYFFKFIHESSEDKGKQKYEKMCVKLRELYDELLNNPEGLEDEQLFQKVREIWIELLSLSEIEIHSHEHIYTLWQMFSTILKGYIDFEQYQFNGSIIYYPNFVAQKDVIDQRQGNTARRYVNSKMEELIKPFIIKKPKLVLDKENGVEVGQNTVTAETNVDEMVTKQIRGYFLFVSKLLEADSEAIALMGEDSIRSYFKHISTMLDGLRDKTAETHRVIAISIDYIKNEFLPALEKWCMKVNKAKQANPFVGDVFIESYLLRRKIVDAQDGRTALQGIYSTWNSVDTALNKLAESLAETTTDVLRVALSVKDGAAPVEIEARVEQAIAEIRGGLAFVPIDPATDISLQPPVAQSKPPRKRALTTYGMPIPDGLKDKLSGSASGADTTSGESNGDTEDEAPENEGTSPEVQGQAPADTTASPPPQGGSQAKTAFFATPDKPEQERRSRRPKRHAEGSPFGVRAIPEGALPPAAEVGRQSAPPAVARKPAPPQPPFTEVGKSSGVQPAFPPIVTKPVETQAPAPAPPETGSGFRTSTTDPKGIQVRPLDGRVTDATIGGMGAIQQDPPAIVRGGKVRGPLAKAPTQQVQRPDPAVLAPTQAPPQPASPFPLTQTAALTVIDEVALPTPQAATHAPSQPPHAQQIPPELMPGGVAPAQNLSDLINKQHLFKADLDPVQVISKILRGKNKVEVREDLTYYLGKLNDTDKQRAEAHLETIIKGQVDRFRHILFANMDNITTEVEDSIVDLLTFIYETYLVNPYLRAIFISKANDICNSIATERPELENTACEIVHDLMKDKAGISELPELVEDRLKSLTEKPDILSANPDFRITPPAEIAAKLSYAGHETLSSNKRFVQAIDGFDKEIKRLMSEVESLGFLRELMGRMRSSNDRETTFHVFAKRAKEIFHRRRKTVLGGKFRQALRNTFKSDRAEEMNDYFNKVEEFVWEERIFPLVVFFGKVIFGQERTPQ